VLGLQPIRCRVGYRALYANCVRILASHRSCRSRCLRRTSRRRRRIGLRNRLVLVLYTAAWPPSVSQGIRPTRIDLCVAGLGISTVCLGAYTSTISTTWLSFPHRDRTSLRLEEPMPCVFTTSSRVLSCFSFGNSTIFVSQYPRNPMYLVIEENSLTPEKGKPRSFRMAMTSCVSCRYW
jgi:hypothetical protein